MKGEGGRGKGEGGRGKGEGRREGNVGRGGILCKGRAENRR